MSEKNRIGKEIINELLENYDFFSFNDLEYNLWDSDSSLLQVDEDEKKLSLDMIEVDRENRRKGKGTKIMKLLCDLADKYNKEIRLKINDGFGVPKRVLVKFYYKFGFKYNDDEDMYIRKSRGALK